MADPAGDTNLPVRSGPLARAWRGVTALVKGPAPADVVPIKPKPKAHALAKSTTKIRPIGEKVPSRKAGSGWVGTPMHGGLPDVEHNPDLDRGAWRGDASTIGEGLRLYREDSEVRSCINSLVYPHLNNPWRMEPADPNDPECRMIAGAAEDMWIKDPEWLTLQRDRFMCVRDGVRLEEFWAEYDPAFVAHAWDEEGEKVKRWVRQPTGRQGLYVAKLAPRLPHTIQEWQVNDDGSLKGIVQTSRDDGSGNYDSNPEVPAERLLRWTHGQEGNNWEGDAAIRPAWGPAKVRRDIVIDIGIASQRFGIGGWPVIEETEKDSELSDEDWDTGEEMARDLANGENQFVLTPWGMRMRLESSNMEGGEFLWKVYDGMGRSIHRMCGTMHNYSGEGYGSRSEFEAKFDAYLMMIAHLGKVVAGPLNALLREWCQWNGWPPEKAPTLTYDDMQAKTAQDMAELIKTAKEAGALTNQPDDEAAIREAGSLPPLTSSAMEDGETIEGEIIEGDEEADGEQDPTPRVKSALEVVKAAVDGEISAAGAAAMLRRFFNLSAEDADAMLADVDKQAKERDTGGGVEGAPSTPAPDDSPPAPPVTTPPPGEESGLEGLSRCGCGAVHGETVLTLDGAEIARAQMADAEHALAIAPRGKLPPRAECMRYAAGIGPIHALAEAYFSANRSRIGREERMEMTAADLRRQILRIGDEYAGQLAGKTVGEAAKVKLPAASLVGISRALKRHYRALFRTARGEVKQEIAEQKADPDYPAKLAEAVDQMRMEEEDLPSAFARVFALATIGDTGKGEGPRNEIEQLDIEDFIGGAVRTTTENIGRQVQQSAQAAVQNQAVTGDVTQTSIFDALNRVFTERAIQSTVKPDMQGVYSTGRRAELSAEQVPLGLYTVTPELSSQVCDICLDTASDPGNPFLIGGPEESDFAVPNPNCMGTLGGQGNPCYCAIIGLSLPPDSDVAREIARGGVEGSRRFREEGGLS